MSADDLQPARRAEMPPLENGDRLPRCEFERRYDAATNLKKAELVEGIVYTPSPLRAQSHAQPNNAIAAWLGAYGAHAPHVSALDNPRCAWAWTTNRSPTRCSASTPAPTLCDLAAPRCAPSGGGARATQSSKQMAQ